MFMHSIHITHEFAVILFFAPVNTVRGHACGLHLSRELIINNSKIILCTRQADVERQKHLSKLICPKGFPATHTHSDTHKIQHALCTLTWTKCVVSFSITGSLEIYICLRRALIIRMTQPENQFDIGRTSAILSSIGKTKCGRCILVAGITASILN